MATCLVPDFPDVNIALEHLAEVDKQLRENGVPFSQEASHHLSEIAEAIKELEASRKAAHEELEVETIETSKLRHQVLRQRDDIMNEVSAGVAAAREANADQLNQLQMDIRSTEQDIAFMEKKQKLLEEQNTVLSQDRELLKGRHDDVIAQLNCQLSDRANKQIVLNETLNEIQSIKEKITQVDTARNILEQVLVQERVEFTEKKQMLEMEIKEIMNSIHEQRNTNATARRGLEVASAELVSKEEQVKDHWVHISKLEKHITRLTASQMKHKEQLEHNSKISEELDRQKEVHEKELQEVRKTFQQKIQALQEKIPEFETEMEDGQKVNSNHLESIAKLSGSFGAQRRREDDAMEENCKLSRQLSKSKKRLEERIASIAKYKLEVKEMEEEMRQLHETNIVSAEMFQKNMEDLEGQLSKEMKSRAAFEVKKDELCHSLENLQKQHKHYVGELSSAITLTKTRHRKLQEEERKLQDHVAMSSLIEHLTNKVTSAEEECRQMEIDYHTEIQQLTMEAESITQARLHEEEALKAQECVLQEVQAQYETDHTRHQTLKNQTTELSSRKNKLEASIQEIQERTAALLVSQEELKWELKALRAKHMETLANQVAQIVATEKSIYENGLMLEQVNMENSRLHLCIEQMKEDIVDAKKDKEKYTQEMAWMKQEVQDLCRMLMKDWVIDKLATEESVERDEKVLEGIRSFTVMIRAREHQIRDINSRLEKELAAMGSLLKTAKTQQKHQTCALDWASTSEGSTSVLEQPAIRNKERGT